MKNNEKSYIRFKKKLKKHLIKTRNNLLISVDPVIVEVFFKETLENNILKSNLKKMKKFDRWLNKKTRILGISCSLRNKPDAINPNDSYKLTDIYKILNRISVEENFDVEYSFIDKTISANMYRVGNIDFNLKYIDRVLLKPKPKKVIEYNTSETFDF